MEETRLKGLWLEVTKACNLSCSHCGNNSGPHQPLMDGMSVDDWKRIIIEATGMGADYLQFIGGEPTIYPGLVSLIKLARDQGFSQIDVFSNATRINSASALEFSQLNVQFAVSVYGHTPAIHALFTNSLRSHRQTERGIRLLREHGVPVRVGIVVNDETASSLEQTKEYVAGLGVTDVHVDRVRAVGRLDAGNASEDLSQLCGRCGQDMLNVTATGEVFPCLFSIKSRLGRITESSLKEIMQSKARLDFRARLINEKSNLSLLCSPYSCGPDHSCVPHTSSPHCGPDFCFPGRKRTAVDRVFHRS